MSEELGLTKPQLLRLRTARAIAGWWGDHLRSGLVFTNGTDETTPEGQTTATLAKMGQSKQFPENNSDSINCFEDALTWWSYWWMTIHRGINFDFCYDPDDHLMAAAKISSVKVNPFTLPSYSTCRATPGSIRVKSGYAQPTVELPLSYMLEARTAARWWGNLLRRIDVTFTEGKLFQEEQEALAEQAHRRLVGDIPPEQIELFEEDLAKRINAAMQEDPQHILRFGLERCPDYKSVLAKALVFAGIQPCEEVFPWQTWMHIELGLVSKHDSDGLATVPLIED